MAVQATLRALTLSEKALAHELLLVAWILRTELEQSQSWTTSLEDATRSASSRLPSSSSSHTARARASEFSRASSSSNLTVDPADPIWAGFARIRILGGAETASAIRLELRTSGGFFDRALAVLDATGEKKDFLTRSFLGDARSVL
ncbi:hypothetical protein BKA62DRAFT_769029 [Auriculariales sp. MPI-PUGE-AT-0066]|nr:hypothetical protein BKA62DRAFT_769029 [Auriculariales sp. MPI-PUGE-AT-0066]